MRMRVLGCSGGELPRHKTTCFLVDGRLAIDAGALTSSLSLEALLTPEVEQVTASVASGFETPVVEAPGAES